MSSETNLLQPNDVTLAGDGSDTLNDVVGNLETAKAAIDNLVNNELKFENKLYFTVIVTLVQKLRKSFFCVLRKTQKTCD